MQKKTAGYGQLDGAPREATTRRTVLKTGAAALGVGIAGLGAVRLGSEVLAQDATPTIGGGTAVATECVLTPDLTEGPYYLAGELIRADITERTPGAALALRIAVQDITTCAPLANAAVEIWHCDAQGYYSGIVGENPGGGGDPTGDENASTTFLRGIQLTDEDGMVEFATIYPGWYTSRTPHIHMKVHVEGTAADATGDVSATATPEGGLTYQGGHTSHTGQLFFDDAMSDAVYATEAYARTSEQGKITNEEDNIFGEHGDDPGFLVDLTGSAADGLSGMIMVGVDPSAVASEGGMDGGAGGGPPGGPGGSPPAGGLGGPPPDQPGGTPPSG